MKLNKFLTLLLVLGSLLAMTSCFNDSSDNLEWTKNETHHWHQTMAGGVAMVSDKAEHTWDDGKVTVEATISQEGEMTYTCTVCEYEKKEVIEKITHEHTFGDWQKDENNHWLECSACGESKDLAAHEYTWETQTEATCASAEIEIGTCICGKTATREGDAALGHTEVVDQAVAATCTETGLTEGKHCSVCNEVLVAQEELAALGHIRGEAVKENEKASTCTVAGSYDSVVYCSACETEMSRETVTLDLANHTWNDGEVTAAPGCESTGVKSFTCSVCGEIKTEEVAALGHVEEVVSGKAPTCTESGLTDGKKCSVCDETLVTQEVIPATGDHNYSILKNDETNHWYECGCGVKGELVGHEYEWTTVSFASCLEAEVELGLCSCGYETTRTGDAALGHKASASVKENEVASTCTVAGNYDAVVYCSVCSAELSRETVTLDLADHTWNDGEITTAPSCESTGVKTFTCSVCGETKNETLAALGHTEVVDKAVAATCTETGLTEGKHCSVCNEVLVAQQEVAANGHTASAAVEENRVASTCSVAGSYDSVVYCSVCSSEMSRTQVDLALSSHTSNGVVHQYSNDYTTCTISETCSNCEATIVSETIALSYQNAGTIGGSKTSAWNVKVGRSDKYLYFMTSTEDTLDTTVHEGIDIFLHFGSDLVTARTNNTFGLFLFAKNNQVTGNDVQYNGNDKKVFEMLNIYKTISISETSTSLYCILPFEAFDGYDQDGSLSISFITEKGSNIEEWTFNEMLIKRENPARYVKWLDDNTLENKLMTEELFNEYAAQVLTSAENYVYF